MSKITYTNKQEATDPNNPIDPIEKFKFEDANEIKTSVNELYDTTIKIGDNTVPNTGFKLIDDNYNVQVLPAAILIKNTGNTFQGQISRGGILWNDTDEGSALTLVPSQIQISPASGVFAGMNAYGGFSFNGGGNSGFLSPGGLSGSNANSNYSMNSSVTQGTNPSGNYTHTYGVVNGTSADATTAFTLTPEALTLRLGGIPKIISYTALPELPIDAIEFLLPNIGGTLLTDATTAYIKNGPEVAQDANININGNINLNNIGYIDNVTGVTVRGDGNVSTPNLGAANASISLLTIGRAKFDVNSESDGNYIEFFNGTVVDDVRHYSQIRTDNGGFEFNNGEGLDILKIGYDGKLSLGNKSITIGTPVGSNVEFALPEFGGTLLTTADVDLSGYLSTGGGTMLGDLNISSGYKLVGDVQSGTLLTDTARVRSLLTISDVPNANRYEIGMINGDVQFTNPVTGEGSYLDDAGQWYKGASTSGSGVKYALMTDLGSYLQNYDTGDTVLNLTNASLHIKAVAGEAFFDPTSLVMYPATGGDVHLSQNSIGFNKNGGDTSFSADEFKILFKPVWNKSATLKISDTATGHQEFTLPETTGVLAKVNDYTTWVGYNATETQQLTHVSGVLTWVTTP